MKDTCLIAVLENPIYIRNIGNAIRNVNGLGVDRIYFINKNGRLDNDVEELKKRRTILKHSNGSLTWTEVKVFPDNKSCLEELKKDGFTSYATSPAGLPEKNISIYDAELRDEKLAIWFGDESHGLSAEVLNACSKCLVIPMQGKVESLNLSSTTALVLFEAIRQRQ
jgi:tRNA (guanosine-2'-O-)-methyltransferase